MSIRALAIKALDMRLSSKPTHEPSRLENPVLFDADEVSKEDLKK